MSARAVSARLRIAGESLDPLEVTKALRLPPDHAHRNGEPRLQRRSDGSVREDAPYRQGLWVMSSARWVASDDLDVHLRWLLDQLEPRQAELQLLLEGGASAQLLCHSTGPSEEATALPGATLARCLALSLPVELARAPLAEEE